MCRELRAGQGQERSRGRVQAEAVLRQDVRLLSEWYGLAMDVARYVVHTSGESSQLGLAAQLALQMPRMPEDPGAWFQARGAGAEAVAWGMLCWSCARATFQRCASWGRYARAFNELEI